MTPYENARNVERMGQQKRPASQQKISLPCSDCVHDPSVKECDPECKHHPANRLKERMAWDREEYYWGCNRKYEDDSRRIEE